MYFNWREGGKYEYLSFLHLLKKINTYLCIASLAEHVTHHIVTEHLCALLSVVEYHIDRVHSMNGHEAD